MRSSINQIIETVAQEFGVTPRAILGDIRAEFIVIPRMAAMVLVRTHLGLKTTTVGYYFNRNHSTVSHAQKMFSQHYQTNKAFRKAYQNIEEKLKNTEL